MTACARTINITCHCTVDGVPENSVQVRAQAVAMATKHPDISLVCRRKSLFGCTLLLISIPVTACAHIINVTCYSTVDGVSEISVQVRAQAVAMATKHPDILLVCRRKSLFGCTLLLIPIPVTACARTINVTCYSTVDGVSEISVQVCAQAVAMATKHPHISLVCERKSLFGCIFLLIPIFVTACARTTNVTCHSTVDEVSEISVQVRAQAVAMTTKHPHISLVCRRNPYVDAHSS